MALLNKGYFAANYFPRSYWQPLYWQAYGTGISVEPEIPTTYTVTIVAADGGYTNLGTGSHVYEEATTIVVTAIPDATHTFDYWLIGSTQDTENPYDYTVTANLTLTPVFEEIIPADNLTIFDIVLQTLEQINASTLFDVCLTELEQHAAEPFFDIALTVLEQTSLTFTSTPSVTDESVIFDEQIFDEEIFYEDT